MSERDPRTIALSLVSHTNAGKTTLARTLLGRDVGEVRDAPHVTEFADVHTMLETADGERLLLWDTPGFGDSARLLKRLRQSAQPVGWFMSQVWDRWRDRAFWATQQALRNVRDEADVMLYLVNASEEPSAAGYVGTEMNLLAWVGKPVVVLLNQLGAPRGAAVEAAEIARWKSHLAPYAHVRVVLPLDAFARAWVQELTLLHAIEAVLDADRAARMARLRAAWQARREHTFDAAMRSIAASLARLASMREVLPEGSALRSRLRSVGAAIGLGTADATPAAVAQRALAERLDAEVRANTLELLQLHGLGGAAQQEILTRLARHYELRLRMDEKGAAMWGGMVTGALVGLKADVLSGGLTLGGGLLAGGLLGALGAAGLARCVNLVRGTEHSSIAWNAEALDQMVDAALLRYLAVAHFGRGRGDWVQGETPPHWKDVIARELAARRDELAAIWSIRDPHSESADATALTAALEPLVRDAAAGALARLYPGVAAWDDARAGSRTDLAAPSR
ncbi:MAG TPA: GTPase domain-containing protein [Caldimonas sp.]